MNPTDPGAVPPENQPADVPAPKPWHKPQQEHEEEQNNGGAEFANTDGPTGMGDPVSSAAIDGAGEVAGAALEGASAALDVAGGCADGCGGCSLALLVTLFAAASTAMAFFR